MFGELTGDASWALLDAMEQSYAEAQRHTFDAAAAVLRSCHQTTLADELGRLLPPREPYTPPDVMHADVKRRVLNAASLALHLCCRSELVSELAELRARGAALRILGPRATALRRRNVSRNAVERSLHGGRQALRPGRFAFAAPASHRHSALGLVLGGAQRALG